jgi:hypothetical protein
VPVPTVSLLLLTLLPQALGVTLPMALLAGLLMALGRLSGDRETVALLACGVNPLRLLRPALAMGAAAAGLTLYVLVDVLPDSTRKFREVTAQFLRQTAESDVKPQMFYDGVPNKVLVIRETRPGGGWDGVFLADTSQPGQISVVTAEHGRLALDKERLIVNIGLDDVVTYVPSDQPGLYTVGAARTNTLQVDPKSMCPESSGETEGDASYRPRPRVAHLEQRVQERRGPGPRQNQQEAEQDQHADERQHPPLAVGPQEMPEVADDRLSGGPGGRLLEIRSLVSSHAESPQVAASLTQISADVRGGLPANPECGRAGAPLQAQHVAPQEPEHQGQRREHEVEHDREQDAGQNHADGPRYRDGQRVHPSNGARPRQADRPDGGREHTQHQRPRGITLVEVPGGQAAEDREPDGGELAQRARADGGCVRQIRGQHRRLSHWRCAITTKNPPSRYPLPTLAS